MLRRKKISEKKINFQKKKFQKKMTKLFSINQVYFSESFENPDLLLLVL